MAQHRVYPEISRAQDDVPKKGKSRVEPNIVRRLKLPDYFKHHSSSIRNGVFVFNQAKPQPAHNGKIGPMGWDLVNYPLGGYAFEGLIGFTIVWNAGKSYITYSEAASETEAQWLRDSPCAARTLPEFFTKLVQVSRDYSDDSIKKLASYTIQDLGLDEDFLLNLSKRAKGRKLNPIDEDKLAQVIYNPKEGQMIYETNTDRALVYDGTTWQQAKPSALAYVAYRASTDISIASTTSTTLVDVSATNLAVTFTVPPSGRVMVFLNALADSSASVVYWGLREDSSIVASTQSWALYQAANSERMGYSEIVTGLTAGATKTWKWAHCVNSGTAQLYCGPTYGSAIMEIRRID